MIQRRDRMQPQTIMVQVGRTRRIDRRVRHLGDATARLFLILVPWKAASSTLHERSEADLRSFCEQAGLAVPVPVNCNVSDPSGMADGEYRHTRTVIRSSLDKGKRIFHDDFELFDYRNMKAAI